MQVLNLKHFRFPKRSQVDKIYLCRIHSGTYNHLGKLMEYDLYVTIWEKAYKDGLSKICGRQFYLVHS